MSPKKHPKKNPIILPLIFFLFANLTPKLGDGSIVKYSCKFKKKSSSKPQKSFESTNQQLDGTQRESVTENNSV